MWLHHNRRIRYYKYMGSIIHHRKTLGFISLTIVLLLLPSLAVIFRQTSDDKVLGSVVQSSDINADGAISLDDATIIRKHIEQDTYDNSADLNGDRKITPEDLKAFYTTYTKP